MSQQRGGSRGRGGPPRGRASPAPSSTSSRGDRGGRGGGGNFGGGGRGGGDFARGGARGGGPGGGSGFRGPPMPAEIFATGTPAKVDQRLSMDELVKDFGKLRVGPEMPLRPGFGTVGKVNVLRANFFALKLPPKFAVYDYEVAISPKADLRGPRKARIFELLEGSPECAPFRGYIAHDRSGRLVSARQLPQPLTATIKFFEEGAPGPTERSPTYNIEINFTRTLEGREITP